MDLQSLFRIPVKLQLIFLYCFGGKHYINNCKFTFDTASYEEQLELLVYNYIEQKELGPSYFLQVQLHKIYRQKLYRQQLCSNHIYVTANMDFQLV